MTPLQHDLADTAAQARNALADLAETALKPEAWPPGDAPEPALDALEHLAALRAHVEYLTALTVRHARVRGCSWSQIADPLAITRQGAQQRWG